MARFNNAKRTENRFSIFRTEGFHLFNDPEYLEIEITETRDGINLYSRNQETGINGFGNDFFKFFTEEFNILRFQRYIGLREVSAVTPQPLPACMQCFV